jgi:hypothetical protein
MVASTRGSWTRIQRRFRSHSFGCVALAVAVLVGVAIVVPGSALALHASETYEAQPEYIRPNPLTAAQAVAYLNAQREASGIPGGLVEEPRLSEGCEQYTNTYVPVQGQYPHTEIPGQPGYTELGSEAASSSDLSPSTAGWSSTVNPWTGAPLHLSALFDPAATTAWYGERSGPFTVTKGENVCMGASGTRQLPEPSAYSLPGTGSVNVPFAERSAESPYTPAEAVGLHSEAHLGPTFILWPGGFAGAPSAVSLQAVGGPVVPIRVATPETPSPTPKSWPFAVASTLGDYSQGASFVVPVHPLAASTAYTLTAEWQPPTALALQQVIRFTTAKRYVGRITLRTTGSSLVVSATPAVGEAVTLRAAWGVTVCVLPQRPCPVDALRHEYNAVRQRVLHPTTPTVEMRLPRRPAGDTTFEAYATVHKFKADGQRWWEPSTVFVVGR